MLSTSAGGRPPTAGTRSSPAGLRRCPRARPDERPALTGGRPSRSRHDFPGGLALARQANRLEPDLAATYPPLIDGLIETGRYGAAAAAIERLLNLKPGPPAYARLSYFEELHGNRGAALRAMRLAAKSALPGTEASAFGHALVGDLLFDAGRYREAARSYETALVGNAGYVPARGRAVERRGGHRPRAAGDRRLPRAGRCARAGRVLRRARPARGGRRQAPRRRPALRRDLGAPRRASWLRASDPTPAR